MISLCMMFLLGAFQPDPAAPEAIPAEKEAAILTNIRQLTSGKDFDRAGEAYFSPDNSTVIFQAVPKGQKHYQMYVAPVKREGETIVGLGETLRISADPSRNTCGWFSPDGKTILFASTANKESPDEPTAGYQREGRDYRWSYPSGMELWVMPIADRSLMRPLTDNNFYDAEGSFSADGTHIIFTSNRSGDLELYAMKADGSGVVQLTNAKGYDGGPFFSPDGKKITYRSDRAGNDLLQVFVSDVVYDDKGNITGLANEKQLTADANVNWGPFWHPSGEWLVWSTSVHGHHNYEIYLMRTDGSQKTRVTYAAGADVLPAFSSDGKKMIWSGKRTDDKTTQVFVADFALP